MEEKINVIAEKLAREIIEEYEDEKKLIISDIEVEHRGSGPFRECFSIGFWVSSNGFVYKFFSISRVSAAVISADPFNTAGSTHQFVDVKSSVTYEEAKKILQKVKEILSGRYEIERYYKDEDEYIDEFFNSYV